MNNFITLSNTNIIIELGLNQLQLKGVLVYEYNPLKVLRLNKDTIIDDYLYPKGSLVNLDTPLLNFDLNHPVEILPQLSYDGSVNLILNDGTNYPKLINTRFTSTGLDTYQIIDREGDNDTNIYDEDTFESDISLYRRVNNIVNLSFSGLTTDGNLKVGNYVFYFKLSDSDGNETDFIAESGIVSCHIGNLNDPLSILGGIRDENSYKSANFIVSNIDSSYNNVVVYYTRSTSDIDGNEFTTSFKISKTYSIYNNIAKICITGFENTESISLNDINIGYNVIDSACSQASCQNRLFLSNVHKPEINYKELLDLSLRFLPYLNVTNSIGFVNENYIDETGQYEYYNANNIYYKLGYWNDEIYRLGIVYILNDYTLSPVFNIRGINNLSESVLYTEYPLYDDNGDRYYISINKDTFELDSINENSKGVVRINYSGSLFNSNGIIPIGLNIKIELDVIQELKKYTKGCFIVRQKRIPTTLCLAVTIGIENTSHLPVLPIENEKYLVERFLDDDRILTHDFGRRCKLLEKNSINIGGAAICPEFELKLAYFNLLFTGTQFTTNNIYTFSNNCFNLKGTYFYNLNYNRTVDNNYNSYYITAVKDDLLLIKGKNELFSSRAGEAEDVSKISYIDYINKSSDANNIVRGSFGPYIGLEGYNINNLSLIDIKIPNYDEMLMNTYFSIRYEDSSSFYAITDRLSWDDINEYIYNVFRGDCFIGNFTHRMCRNFLDPSAPINDIIIDQETWKNSYDINNSEKNSEINRGDVNAIKLGHWVTVKLCSNVNLSMRCLDASYSSEEGLTGKKRGFYPLQSMSVSGESKIPESSICNLGFNSTTSDKYYFTFPKVPAVKNLFNTRIMYSDININDSFKNGFRVFKLTNYLDYPSTYGNITKILEWYGNIIAIFEHGAALIPINERTVAGSGDGGTVFINTKNVLPINPKMLSTLYGTQWRDSIVKTPYYIYGIDTVAKKIWRTNGQVFEVISDFKLQKFLNSNITLGESEKTPVIGIRNVKSHYNAFKGDVMFTFYDDLNNLEEKAWSICYNEIMQKFITFYSWIPSFSENINNIYISFDRNTSKDIARLSNNYPLISLKNGGILESKPKDFLLGELLFNKSELYGDLTYTITDERLKNYYHIDGNKLYGSKEVIDNYNEYIIPILVTINNSGTNVVEGEVINIESKYLSKLYITTKDNFDNKFTYFWKHGNSGLLKTTQLLRPTHWYGYLHPFEFEFIVTDNPSTHKIFNNLLIISNNAEPDSFHFEITGDVYDFALDKANMYYRLEMTKLVYLNLGSNITYDNTFTNYISFNDKPENYPNGIIDNTPVIFTKRCSKSTIFPLYYARKKEVDKIQDIYEAMTKRIEDLKEEIPKRLYYNLSGSEIIYDKNTNSFGIATHKGAYDIKDYGRLRGNMNYFEDRWVVEIPSITYMLKNEEWVDKPIIYLNWIPNDLLNTELSYEGLPNTYNMGEVSTSLWTYRKETRIRDKYVKIKVRYTGEKLAIITALKTLYTISYA